MATRRRAFRGAIDRAFLSRFQLARWPELAALAVLTAATAGCLVERTSTAALKAAAAADVAIVDVGLGVVRTNDAADVAPADDELTMDAAPLPDADADAPSDSQEPDADDASAEMAQLDEAADSESDTVAAEVAQVDADPDTTPVDNCGDKTCDDGKQCTLDDCDPKVGCINVNAKVGTPCDDGSACTSSDACQLSGSCVGSAVICDDGKPCTVDSCGPTSGCKHTAAPSTQACDDGSACTTGDKCTGGTCVGVAKVCDDGKPCTIDGCDKLSGCTAVENAGSCDDADACTEGDKCAGGKCSGTKKVCDDGNPCTTDSCALAKGCTQTAVADGATCPEGKCTAGQCKPVPVVKVWPFGTDGDLVFSAPNVITLDADSREPPIWDFAKCQIGGTLKIVGKKPWVLIGCAGDLVLDGTIDMQASYDVAEYKDSQQPDTAGKLTGVKLSRAPFTLVGGAGQPCPIQECAGQAPGGSQSGGNGGGGAGGPGNNGNYANYCGTGGASATGGPGGSGGKGGNGGNSDGAPGSQGGTAAKPAAAGQSSLQASGAHGGGGGGGGFHGATAANLYLQVVGNLSGSGKIVLGACRSIPTRS